ncbi:rho GTPase-activating protein 45-like isoform X1 [Cottoperca gobio]|uniref:Rho GTPase-activating protein 45-like isoform X1 n=1 Tax=Cottoperca gobio TaxID=56716 RepID=A0A6J2PL98_COTGO|nr:rho GTPase-activating protein 45-like isoform X1 [Cottoperca gobio]
MCDSSSSSRRKTDRLLPWLKVCRDDTEHPLSASSRAHKWRVGGWVGGLYVKLKEVGMDGKGTLKMFARKKRELIKTPSISKKSRAGSPGAHSSAPSSLSILQEQTRRDAGDVTLSSPSSSSSTLTPTSAGFPDSSLSCPGTPSTQHGKLAAMQGVGCPSPVSTLKRPTALSRHASAAGFPLQSWVFTKGQGKGALTPPPPSDGPESTAIEVGGHPGPAEGRGTLCRGCGETEGCCAG